MIDVSRTAAGSRKLAAYRSVRSRGSRVDDVVLRHVPEDAAKGGDVGIGIDAVEADGSK